MGTRLFDSNAITVGGDIGTSSGSDLDHLKKPNCVVDLGNGSLVIGDPENDRILITTLDNV